jgi:stalled ribosome rescue protein Dom34
METKKQIGIWMDHSVAHIMEPKNNAILTNSVLSEFTTEQRQNSLGKNENLMHNKEQTLQSKYYKNIKEVIKGHQEVLLFGPTTAKDELLNLLKADHHFENVKIEVKSADKMTENQQHAFVKDYFKLS